MAEEWFWKHKGDLLGPLTTEALAELVEADRVHDRDQVRVAETEDWLSGADVKRLFASGDGEKSSAARAAELLSQQRKPGSGRAVSVRPRTSGTWLPDLSSIFTVPWRLVEGAAKRVRIPFPKRGLRWLVLFVAVGISMAILYREIDLGGRSALRYRYDDLWADLDALNYSRATAESGAHQAPLMDELEVKLELLKASLRDELARHPKFPLRAVPWRASHRHTADVHDARAGLLAAASLLQKMLQADDTRYVELVNEFEVEMSDVDVAISGNRWADLPMSDGQSSVDRVTATVLVLDGLLIGGALLIWFRRKQT